MVLVGADCGLVWGWRWLGDLGFDSWLWFVGVAVWRLCLWVGVIGVSRFIRSIWVGLSV